MIFNRQSQSREFERLLRENLDTLYRAGLRLTGNRIDAEDLVQETAARAFRSFGQFSSGTNVRAWLLTILRNLFINEYRKKAREWKMRKLLETQPEAPSREVDLPEYVRRALDDLPEEQRLALTLFYAEGLSYKEIAKVLKCPAGTVMSRLHAARKRLIKSAFPSKSSGGGSPK